MNNEEELRNMIIETSKELTLLEKIKHFFLKKMESPNDGRRLAEATLLTNEDILLNQLSTNKNFAVLENHLKENPFFYSEVGRLSKKAKEHMKNKYVASK